MKTSLVLLALLALLLPAVPAMAGMLPDMAAETADELDAQLVQRLGGIERPAQGMTLIVTTPANLSNLELTCPLARLYAEELATWFVSMGYRVQEARKAQTIMFAPGRGEFGLTRNADIIDEQNLSAMLLLTGSYTVTSQSVRFNMRLIHAATNETLAMASATLPITREVLELLEDGSGMSMMGISPSVATQIPPAMPY